MRAAVWVLLCVLCASAASVCADERAVYLLHCGWCHLQDGRGNPPEVPDLRNELGEIVAYPEGRAYLVQVPGASQAPVDDIELTRIINWILTEFNGDSLQPGFVPLNAEEVSQARRQILADPLKRRAEIWAKYVE